MAALPNPFTRLLPTSRPSQDGPALAQVGSRYLSNFTGGNDALMQVWRPQLREAQQDTQEAWALAASQVIEQLHTSGWMSGGVRSARGQILSDEGLRLNLKPWAGLISSDPKTQAAWSRDVEGRFTIYINDPWNVDFGGRYTMAQLAGQGLDQYFAFGEMVATLPVDERPGTSHLTKFNLIPSMRLSQSNGPEPNVIQGVELNRRSGAPDAYHFNSINFATGQSKQERVQARDSLGRPYVVHVLDNAAGAVRGITPFAPGLRVIRQSDQLANSTLISNLMQTIFSATVESSEVTTDLMRALMGIGEQEDGENEAFNASAADLEGVPAGSFTNLLQARSAWYKNTNIDLGRFGKIAHLFPGEKLSFNRPNGPGANYIDYQRFLLLEIARCMGITYYQLTGDFNGFTYTTAKMAVDEIWPMTLWRRALIGRLYQALFEAWLEEDIMRGFTVLPGGIAQFYAQRQLICRADWRGPPKPVADEEKAAKANQIERAEGWKSTEQIAAERGSDWVEVADSQSATEQYRRDLKLEPLPTIGGGGNGAGSSAVAGGKEDDAAVEGRLVGAMVRGDNAEFDNVMSEYPHVRTAFLAHAARATAHHAGAVR